MKISVALVTGVALSISGMTAATAGDLRVAKSRVSIVDSVAGDTDGSYIVMLEEPSIAAYAGGIDGLEPTSAPARGEKRLNTKSKAAKAYGKYLKERQADVVDQASSELGRDLAPTSSFQWASNGFVVELTAEEAKAMRGIDGIRSVERDGMRQLDTDAGPAWIGAPSMWTNPPNSTMGEGVVVAILDSGINYDHPSFADVGSDGYDHTNPLGAGVYVPGSYCDVTDPAFCNDKLIGAWSFVVEPITPNDSDGHGSHTASTVAGNVVTDLELVAPTTSAFFDISGVAAHANIIAYDVCTGGCPFSALLGALDQVVVDAGNLPNGIAALNYSISGSGDPYSDAVEIGFFGASLAGIAVNASAGNNGPGAGTVAHKSPWITTVAASTHDRQIVNSLIDIDSSGGPIADIEGASFSTGYGPAPIIHANSTAIDPAGQCLNPFPPGTFNGEIVICDRGTIARVQKGFNVLVGGAGGFVLANTDADGESIVADPHFLPATHIGDSDGDVLRAYVAANPDAVATITPYSIEFDASAADVMAGFSSRGPQNSVDVLKPDVTAPGVSIFAALADGDEQGFLSGTSMSSPHSAGAHALMSARYPDWSPYEIKSAIMLSADPSAMLKEDGATPADPFDYGAGRIDLNAAKDAGLVMSITPLEFIESDPGVGGDPKALNLPSMMDSACVGSCTFTRTVTNPDNSTSHWDLSVSGPAGLGLSVAVSPEANSADYNLKLKKGQSAELTITADTTLAPEGWHFGRVHLDRNLDQGPDLGMPIAVYATKASNPNLFTKSVDQETAAPGDILTYEIQVTNTSLAGPITVTDTVPDGTTFVPASETESVVGGSTTTPWAYDAGTNSLTWEGELDPGGLAIAPSPLAGYLPLSLFGIPPVPNPGGCDEGGYLISGLDIHYGGAHYTTAIWSVNGTLELGTASGSTVGFINTPLPDPVAPNNLLAPLWGDLNLCGGGNWYLDALTDGVSVWDIFEWEAVPEWPAAGANSFQIWLERGTSNITFAYGPTSAVTATIGAENVDGTIGDTWYFNGAGSPPDPATDLGVVPTAGGTATLGFQVEIDCSQPAINRADMSNAGADETAIAVTTCP